MLTFRLTSTEQEKVHVRSDQSVRCGGADRVNGAWPSSRALVFGLRKTNGSGRRV